MIFEYHTPILLMLCSDAAFGDLPWREICGPSWEAIRVSDVIDYRNEQSGHAIVVIEKTDKYVKVTESGINNHALWSGFNRKDTLLMVNSSI